MTGGASQPAWSVGDVIGPVDHVVGIQEIVRYAGASGDFNPVHHDEEVARAAGHDRVFAMGMLSAGYLGALLVEAFGPASVESIGVRFRDRVWNGDTVTCSGEVTAVEGDRAEVRLLVRVGERTVLDGRSQVRLAG